ncbi:hypothetical protein CH63R_08286 [Colletotrichum higginsianum IMI 349063]|uniref:Uncharacterized protein n=1 Tax=Colletotrichum higginsianum (strain IMI 349063) TaxID=759273 RepID=A0A1B7YBP0_COLHI|nr:hypothetical protein CH63R_08286 [Colletotrichum higginsianum IMI 349063]OBR09521.1 hypothetical protein CH63R_08286 [Colletotrichum higginsianum IMI 349063]
MIELTVGYVAGFIAAAIVVAQIWCPTAIALILAGLLQDTETAATWNIASRVIQRTWWPTILQSDSVLTHGARLKISLISWSVPIIGVLIAITGVVTPLGLYEELDTLDSRVGSFAYLRDTGSFGAGTSERGLHNFSRACSWGHGFTAGPAPCPYSGNSVLVTGSNGTFNFTMPGGYSSKIAPIVREIFSSGTKGRTTVSNFFDIEWRQITTRPDRIVDNGTEVAVGAYRQLESHIMDPSVKVVEGLVVDAENGGIGLRNHTAPTNVEQGATWFEDLLFIEPIASCVNTNLTLDFEITMNSTVSNVGIDKLRLTDRGGFVNINQTYPTYDHDNAQSNPDLRARAYKAAFLNNAWTMMYLNVTTGKNASEGRKAWSYLDSELGKEFPLAEQALTNYRALGFSSKYGSYLDLLGTSSGRNKAANWSNPFKVTSTDFRGANIICSGAGARDFANISNIYVACGLMRGAPRRVDGGASTALFENHSKWSSSLHSCAAAVRAVVKTVSFSVNGTNGLDSLTVTSISPKEYANPDDTPLWGLEDSGLAMDGISAVWGIISPEYATRPNISTVKQPAFHLPGYSDSLGGATLGGPNGILRYNIPGSDFASGVMETLFGGPTTDGGAMGTGWPFDLVGAANMPVFKRWQALSDDPDRVPEIIKLIWTDVAASAVVGTKGVLGPRNAGAADETVRITVKPVGKRIKYRWAFGIPAFVLLLVMLGIAVALILAAVLKSSTVAVLRHRLQQVTVGRVLTTFLYPEHSNLLMSSKEWSRLNGDKAVDLGGVPQKGSVPQHAVQFSQGQTATPAEEVKVRLMAGEGKPVH